MSLFKKLMLCAYIAALAPSNAMAEDFKPLLMRSVAPHLQTKGIAVVIFHSRKPVEIAIDKVSEAMLVENPNAAYNKWARWISYVVDKGYDEKRQCGFIIGQLRFGDGNKDWEDAMMAKASRYVDLINVEYATGGTLQQLKGTAGDSDGTFEACIE